MACPGFLRRSAQYLTYTFGTALQLAFAAQSFT